MRFVNHIEVGVHVAQSPGNPLPHLGQQKQEKFSVLSY